MPTARLSAECIGPIHTHIKYKIPKNSRIRIRFLLYILRSYSSIGLFAEEIGLTMVSIIIEISIIPCNITPTLIILDRVTDIISKMHEQIRHIGAEGA